MKLDYITLILLIAFFLPLLKGFLISYRSIDQKRNIESLLSNIFFVISMFIGSNIFKKIFITRNMGIYRDIYNAIPNEIIQLINKNPIISYLLILPLTIVIIYLILKWIGILVCSILIYPIFDVIEKLSRKRSSLFKRILGMFFQLPKSFIYLTLVCFVLNYLSAFNIFINSNVNLNSYLEKSNLYNKLCTKVVVPISNSEIAKKLPNILNNSFKIKEVKTVRNENNNDSHNNRKVIVYYNGVTLDDAIKSNDEIDVFSKKLTKNNNKTYDKSKVIYTWISKNVKYDYSKAKKILNNDFSIKSGTINTFYTRKGICFDYSSLFVSMCKANGIKVRILTGKGFDGRSWVNHAWNQVYIKEKGTWVNVDTTFGVGGNYFNNDQFLLDHKEPKIAGEW